MRDGTCKQTIRHLGKVPRRPGDTALLHGWEGKPYYSHWDWRKDVVLSTVQNMKVLEAGIASAHEIDDHHTSLIYDNSYFFYKWESLDWLANLDFIEPPTGVELGRVLISKNSEIRKNGFMPAQIIRWL